MAAEEQRATFVRKHFLVHELGVREWTERIEVRVMAVADGYAMVRGKNEVPFVCDEIELSYNTRNQRPA